QIPTSEYGTFAPTSVSPDSAPHIIIAGPYIVREPRRTVAAESASPPVQIIVPRPRNPEQRVLVVSDATLESYLDCRRRRHPSARGGLFPRRHCLDLYP